MLTLSRLIDEHKCYETVRQLRWPNGVCCVECESASVTKRGKHETHPARQRYVCGDCGRQFDDLTGSIFAGRHQPLQTWMACLYLMGLNLSNRQIAQELSLHKDDVHQMTSELRQAVADKRQEVQHLCSSMSLESVSIGGDGWDAIDFTLTRTIQLCNLPETAIEP
ncbi:MAG: transposase [Cyanobacteria bacterium J06631_9]